MIAETRQPAAGRPITVLRRGLDELAAEAPNLARHLRSLGYVAVVTLVSGVPATMTYETGRGRLEYASGSRALLERFRRSAKKNFAAPLYFPADPAYSSFRRGR